MKILWFFLMIISIMYMNTMTPMIMMLLILVQTFILCSFMWLYMNYSWFSMILFLIFLGGLMVLFIYIVSLASNEKIFIMKNKLIPVMLMTIFMFYFINKNKMFQLPLNMMLTPSFNFMFSLNLFTLTITTIIYLLLTLVVVIKVTNKINIPLKMMMK